jgi:hypothetical protein
LLLHHVLHLIYTTFLFSGQKIVLLGSALLDKFNICVCMTIEKKGYCVVCVSLFCLVWVLLDRDIEYEDGQYFLNFNMCSICNWINFFLSAYWYHSSCFTLCIFLLNSYTCLFISGFRRTTRPARRSSKGNWTLEEVKLAL